MIYPCEEFYALEPSRHQNKDRSMPDKIAMALYVASQSDGKSGVDFSALLPIIEQANRHSCLSVYVNVYGRPVSYVAWGYSKTASAAEGLPIWFGDRNSTRSISLVDFAVTEGCLDETISRWITEIDADLLNVRRYDRAKRERTYPIPRLRKFPWCVSSIGSRFSPPKDHAMAEHEKFSRELIDLYRTGSLALKAVCKYAKLSLKMRGLQLVVQLIGIDQCILIYEDEICIAVLIVALSDREGWGGQMNSLFERRLPEFVDGNDVIVVGIFGSERGTKRAIEQLFGRATRMGENIVYFPREVVPDLMALNLLDPHQICAPKGGRGDWALAKIV